MDDVINYFTAPLDKKKKRARQDGRQLALSFVLILLRQRFLPLQCDKFSISPDYPRKCTHQTEREREREREGERERERERETRIGNKQTPTDGGFRFDFFCCVAISGCCDRIAASGQEKRNKGDAQSREEPQFSAPLSAKRERERRILCMC